MATGAASSWRTIGHVPGNPQLPVLPAPSDPITGLVADPIGGAGITFGRPQETILLQNAGAPGRALGFASVWLNQVGATPIPIEFGNITAAKQRTITIHNTNRTSIDVTALDLSAVSGVSLISPGFPVTVPAFSSQEFVVEAAVIGDATFDAEAIFTTSVSTLNVRMTGLRVIIFNTFPEKVIQEQLRFLTDIMIAHDGSEQAMSSRIAPRSAVSLNVRHTDDEERTRLYNLILGANHLLQGLQLWWQSRELTSAALSTDTVLQCATASMEIEDDGNLSLVLPNRSFIEVDVLSFDATTITLQQAVGTALPQQTSVMPLKFGYATDSARINTFAVNMEDLQVRFDLVDYANIGAVDLSYFVLHPVDMLPIITHPLFFDSRTRRGGMKSNQNRLDGQTGTISSTRSEALTRPEQDVLVHCNSLADQHAWRQFLHFLRGSWGKFYLPTGTNDLPLASDFSLGGNTMEIPAMGVANLIGNIAPRRDVKITVAGVDYHRRINSVIDNGATETVTLSSVIPGSGTVPIADFKCSWLTLSRIVGDVATFTHIMRGQSDLRFRTRGVIDAI